MEFKNIFLMNGSDSKNVDKFKGDIDILTVNANIAINNKKVISNTSQNYNIDLIIDPMTYMLQAGPKVLLKGGNLRPSFAKVVNQIFNIDTEQIDFSSGDLMISYYESIASIDDLCESVYNFQMKYFDDLEDLGAFEAEKSKIRYLSAPYFDVKNIGYLRLNNQILKTDLNFNYFRMIISSETDLSLLPELVEMINKSSIEAVEIWVESDMKKEFKALTVSCFAHLEKKLLFKFVSFNEIYFLSNSNIKDKVIGFISAFGYGETRNVYPVGGGLPVNKIYSLVERERIQVNDFFEEVQAKKIDIENASDGSKYLRDVCDCQTCRDIVKNYGLPKILLFADFIEYNRKLKNGKTSRRIAASQSAITLTNYHYINNKLKEYKDFKKGDFGGDRYREWIEKKKLN